MKDIKVIIEELIEYAKKHLYLEDLDALYKRNLLLDILGVDIPYMGEKLNLDYTKDLKVPDILLDEVREYLTSKNAENIELTIVKIMGLLSPLPSQVDKKAHDLEKSHHGEGLDYLFDLSIKNNYIQKTAIDRNIFFMKDYGNNVVEVAINLSKPEKNNKDVAKLLIKTNNIKYPSCLLCKENIGYTGRADHPARENIRYLTMKLGNEDWFLQYSPYAYFDHHAIVVNSEHHNMTINNTTFHKLLEFVDLYPTFFVGSNADLPIVGGSILNHEHYQGGAHNMPLFKAKDKKVFFDDRKVKISSLDWYSAVIRVESKDLEKVSEMSKKIFNAWVNYSDEGVEVIAYTNGVRHNTITPIAKKNNDIYQMNLVLRNNRCNEEHPDGIFHSHKENHHIKQEGIGLIESLGLFILPPRLKRQMGYVEEMLMSNEKNPVETYVKKYEELVIHQQMMEDLVNTHGINLSKEKAMSVVKDKIVDICKEILINSAVFKDDKKGNIAFEKFVKEALK